jgi:nifR3 family TIM-barrel protein
MIKLRNKALLAPMSGITDLPFRRLAHRMGAGLVVAEMVASKMLAHEHKQTLHRVMGDADIHPYVIQISGRDPHMMAEAARIAADLGADMIDINMGCPARKVIKGLAGSALMKNPELAGRIIEAVTEAVDLPVSLKMRLGWDENQLNAAEIAASGEQAGLKMFTVHGRTRNQFYKGRADWNAIRKVVAAVDAPVIANGDILSFEDVEECLGQSCAHGVMIGRGAQGRPWFIGQVGGMLATGTVPPSPPLETKREIVLEHYEDMLVFYGTENGLRNARKHLGWYVEDLISSPRKAKGWRIKLCREENSSRVVNLINELFLGLMNEREAVS